MRHPGDASTRAQVSFPTGGAFRVMPGVPSAGELTARKDAAWGRSPPPSLLQNSGVWSLLLLRLSDSQCSHLGYFQLGHLESRKHQLFDMKVSDCFILKSSGPKLCDLRLQIWTRWAAPARLWARSPSCFCRMRGCLPICIHPVSPGGSLLGTEDPEGSIHLPFSEDGKPWKYDM